MKKKERAAMLREVNTIHIREDAFNHRMRVWRDHWVGDQFEQIDLDEWPAMSFGLRLLGFNIKDHTGSDDE